MSSSSQKWIFKKKLFVNQKKISIRHDGPTISFDI